MSPSHAVFLFTAERSGCPSDLCTMTWNTSFSPLAHEPVGHTDLPTFDRVEDEYVFVVVVGSTPDENGRPVTRSLRVDPVDGRADELLVHVSDGAVEHEPEATDPTTVTVPAPGLGTSPPVRELEAVIGAWFRRHYDPGSTDGVAASDLEPCPSAGDRPSTTTRTAPITGGDGDH